MEAQKKIKTETFKELKHHLNRIGVWRADSTEKEKNLCIIKNCVVFSTLIYFFVPTAWFRVFSAQSIREITESSYFALISLLLIVWYSTLIWKRGEYAAIFNELDEKIEQRMNLNPSVESIYQKTKQNTEFGTKILILIFQVVAVLYSIFPITLSIYKCMTLGYSHEYLQLIYPATYPFNQTTPAGYVVSILGQITTLFIGIKCYVSPLMLTVGICCFIVNFTSDLGMKLRQINDDVIEQQEKKWTATEQIWLMKKLVEFVQFHSDAREFATRFSDVNEGIVFGCPIFTIAVFGSLLLRSKNIIGSGDLIEILQTVLIIFGSLFPFFLLCHFGGSVTHQFENLGKDVYQLEWYKLPIELQKQLPVIIASTQKSIYMRGYGDTRSTYSVLKKILKNKFYYFVLANNL